MALQDTLNAFVQYVQQELFKRPFLNADVNQEAVMVRRGGGPRQLTGLELSDLELIGKRDGQVVGIPIGDLGDLGGTPAERKMIHVQEAANVVWTIPHAFSSPNVDVYVVDVDNQRIEADGIQAVDDDTVVISFTQAQAGKAFLKWFD